MTLEDLATGAPPVQLLNIGADRTLALQVQQRLGLAGLLDPPADGEFGAVSRWAIGEFMRKIGTPAKMQLDMESARALVAPSVAALYAVNDSASLAGRLLRAMRQAGHWVNAHPDCFNIVYVEGMEADGSLNDDKPNVFNDARFLLRVNRAGNPEIAGAWEATTEPGRFYTSVKKLNPQGAARIAFGQYKSWVVGTHNQSNPKTAHEALVQNKDIRVFRDLNEDFEREGDAADTGLFFVNQHCGFDLPKADIGRASAGCLVGRTKGGHREFMALLKSDPRYVASRGYRFMTAVLPASAVPAA
jgi:hypothetical protein